MNALDEALGLARRGFRVFPLHWPARAGCSCGRADCGNIGKHPRTRHGRNDATTDEAVIRRWWSFWPKANVGIATGNGLAVLDVDPRHGGTDSLLELEREHGELITLTASTGGGGLHLYFRGELRTRAGFRPGLDLRGVGGSVVAPPSRHASGGRYEWIAPGDLPMVPEPLPLWLSRIVDPPRQAYQPRRLDVVVPQGRYLEAAIVRECMDVLHAPEGTRNERLNRAAWSLARFVASGRARRDAVVDALTAAGEGAGLDPHEVRTTINSAMRARDAG